MDDRGDDLEHVVLLAALRRRVDDAVEGRRRVPGLLPEGQRVDLVRDVHVPVLLHHVDLAHEHGQRVCVGSGVVQVLAQPTPCAARPQRWRVCGGDQQP